MIWIDVAVRAIAGILGLAILYVAWFVYEDEEKLLQSTIENWWVRFDDLRSVIVSRQTAFVIVVAERTNDVLSRVFGQALITRDSVASATTFATAGYATTIAVAGYIGVKPDFSVTSGVIAFGAFACGIAPLVSSRFRRLPRAVLWTFVTILALILLGDFVLAVAVLTKQGFANGFAILWNNFFVRILAFNLSFTAG